MRVLAISPFHDSSVAVYCDGVLEFFAKEERLTRIKRDMKPWKSLMIVYEKFKGKKIDRIVLTSPTNNDVMEDDYLLMVKKMFDVDSVSYSFCHHKCHASLAFYNSGFDEALVFVIDRNGSIIWYEGAEYAREAETVFIGAYPDVFFPVHKSFWMPNPTIFNKYHEIANMIHNYEYLKSEVHCKSGFSIVKVYEAATSLIGEHPLENGKTMGLSAYGPDKEYPPLFVDGHTPIDAYFHHEYEIGRVHHRSAPVCFSDISVPKSYGVPTENYEIYAEKAKHVQVETQKAALSLIKKYVEKYKIKNICITGGYGLNIIANSY
jgi:carbamoyltransferase